MPKALPQGFRGHWTREGKLYVGAVEDVYSNRIVRYSIDSPLKSGIAVGAEIGSTSPRDNRMGWELLLGIRATSSGTHHRTGVRVYYRSGDTDCVAELPAELPAEL